MVDLSFYSLVQKFLRLSSSGTIFFEISSTEFFKTEQFVIRLTVTQT